MDRRNLFLLPDVPRPHRNEGSVTRALLSAFRGPVRARQVSYRYRNTSGSPSGSREQRSSVDEAFRKVCLQAEIPDAPN